MRLVLCPPLQSVLQQPAQQTLPLGRPRATSILSYLSDGDLRSPGLWSRSQELPEMDSFSSEDPRDTETSTSASTLDVGFLPSAIGPNASIEEEAQEDPPSPGLLPEMAHLAGGPFVERPGWRNLGVEIPNLPRGSTFHNHTIPGGQGKGLDEGETRDGVDEPGVTLERPLQEVLDLLRCTDPSQPRLRELEYQVLSFRDRLKVGSPSAGPQPRFASGGTTGNGGCGQPAWAGGLASLRQHPGRPRPRSGPQLAHLSSGNNNSPHRAGRRRVRGSRGSEWITCPTSSQNWPRLETSDPSS